MIGIPTQLQSLQVLQNLSNPENKISLTDIAGLIGGGILGWIIAGKLSKEGKFIGAVIGAEIGLILVKRVSSGNTLAKPS